MTEPIHDPEGDIGSHPHSPHELKVPDTDPSPAAVIARAKANWRAPKFCSNCMGGCKKGSLLVRTDDEEEVDMLCTLRCLAIWSMTRGWAK